MKEHLLVFEHNHTSKIFGIDILSIIYGDMR